MDIKAIMLRDLNPAPQTRRGIVEPVVWFAIYFLIIAIPTATGTSNGLGYFQQPKGHSLWTPMLLGGAVNIFVASWHAGRAMPLLLRTEERSRYIAGLLLISVVYLAAHLTYQLGIAATIEPDLRGLSIFAWTAENLIALPFVLIISGLYKIVRDWFAHMSDHFDLVDKTKKLEQEFGAVRTELTEFKEKTGTDQLVKFESGREKHQLPIASIFYLKAAGNYVEIVSVNKTHTVYGALIDFEKKLSGGNFIRIHRSYLVNMDRVETINGSSATINGAELPIGPTYKKKLFSQWR